MQRGRGKPDAAAIGTAIGVMSVIVPTEVPIAVDTKQLTTNSTATENFAGIRAGTAHYADKNTGCEEDEEHGQNILVPHTAAHDLKLFIEAVFAILKAGNQQRHKENNHNRNGIETHGNFQSVLKYQAETEIANQKDVNG